MRWKRARALAGLIFCAVIASGCYLGHLADGQMRMLWKRTPVEQLIADPSTPVLLRERLELVGEVRRFAAALGLDVGRRYTSYVPWSGDAVVTTLTATKPGEIEARTTWFPIVGHVPYLGYFDPLRAAAEAERLRSGGLDVCEVPVRAYSTLGWFDDPLTGPMLRQDEVRLVETLFHELLHATVFVPSEADFNEGVAAFVGQEARVRFYAARGGPEAEAREREAVARDRALRGRILALRSEVAALYAAEPPGPARRARRAELEAEARRDLAPWTPGAADATSAAATLRLNDACLALSGTYHGDMLALEAALDALDGDLRAFIALVVAAARTDAPRVRLLGLDPA